VMSRQNGLASVGWGIPSLRGTTLVTKPMIRPSEARLGVRFPLIVWRLSIFIRVEVLVIVYLVEVHCRCPYGVGVSIGGARIRLFL
jgi:hypothetical protein